MAARRQAALADYGVTPDEGRAAEAAARVNGSPVRDRVLTALDMWLAFLPPAEERAGLRAVLRAADPDPYRDAVRGALAAHDAPVIVALAGRAEALDQPARFAAVLGRLGGVPADRRRAVLNSALRARPGDLGLLMALGQTYPVHGPEVVDERVRWYQAALAAHPGQLAALNNLGRALADRGDLGGARACYEDTVRLDGTFTYAHTNLGLTLRGKGDADGAVAAFHEAIRLDPNHPSAHSNLGAILCDVKGDYAGAVAAYREALGLDPRHTIAHANLAWILAAGPARVRDGKQAVEHAARACELTGGANPTCVSILAAAHAEAGDFERAVEVQTKALSLGMAGRERLQLYTRKQPYRDPVLNRREVAPPPREAKPVGTRGGPAGSRP